MIVMQYADNGDLQTYLERNINTLTWKMKLECLKEIALNQWYINYAHLMHCDLHSGNVVFKKRDDTQSIQPFICDLSLSQPFTSPTSNANLMGVLPYIAPDVLHTRKFNRTSDVYSFGIIMHQIANGEPPFRDWSD